MRWGQKMEPVVDPTADLRKHHEKLLKDSRDAMFKDRQRKEAFEGLVRHPGWPILQELLNAMINARGEVVLGPAGSVEGAMALEFIKGAMNGLILARDLPSLIVENTPQQKDDEE